MNTLKTLREYIRIKQKQTALNIQALKDLVMASNLTLDEAGKFFEVLNQMEEENYKVK